MGCIGLIRFIEYASGRIFVFLDMAAFGTQFPHLVRLNQLSSRMGHGATFKKLVTVLFSEVQAAPHLASEFAQALPNVRVSMAVVDNKSRCYRLLLPLFKIRNRLLLNLPLDLMFPKIFGREQHRIQELVLKVTSRDIYAPWLWPRDNDVNGLFRSFNSNALEDYIVVGHRTGAFKVEQARASGVKRVEDIDKTQAFRNTSTKDMASAVEAILDSGLKVIWIGTFDSNFELKPQIRRSIGIMDLRVAPMARMQSFIFKHARGAFFGGHGGMCEIAWAMGIPVAVVNWVPYTGLCAARDISLGTMNPWLLRSGDVSFPYALDSTLVTLKRIVRKESETLLTLRDALRESLFSEGLYASRNLTVIDNSTEEVTHAALEFLKYLQTTLRMRDYFDHEMQLAWRQILSENLGPLRVGQAGRHFVFRKLDRSIPRRDSLCFATISPGFLANNKDLLD